ncbi:virulence-associated E family protein [Arenimonas daejeonensis]|uniref:virulence-associated E family protein n=1 Tax=Arenimonas daejeonensis TaxID=370777 RepID=UPI0011BEF089|nr:virulence-associated E family protein [Arenimonas daejeonensis]
MIADFLRDLRPQGPWVLMAIHPDKKRANDHSPITAKTLATLEEAEHWARDVGRTHSVYYHLNPLRGDAEANKKASRTDVACVEYLHVDIDPVPVEPSKGESADEFKARANEARDAERARILAAIRAYPKPPTFVVDSGNGYQCGWRIRPSDAAELDGTEERADLLSRYNVQIANELGGDHTQDVSRILRLPGCVNRVDAKKRAKGREDRPAVLVEFHPERAFDLSEFQPAPTRTVASKPKVSRSEAEPAACVSTGDLARWAEEAGRKLDDKTLALIATGDASEYGGDRSRMVHRVALDLVRAEVPDALILGALLDKQNPVSAHIYDQKGNKVSYARRQLDRAREKVTAEALERAVTNYSDGDYTPQWNPINKVGVPVRSFHNTVEALQTFGLSFSYDVFRDQRVIGGHRLQAYAGSLTDGAEVILRREVRGRFGFDPGKEALHDAIAELCEVRRCDSLHDHLSALPEWDGEPRNDRWLIDFCGAEDSAFVRAVGAAWLLAAVVRAFEPGAKFDYMLILVGEQGMKKSMALEVIAGGKDFFSDAALLGARDGREVLELSGGVWIQECAELDGITKKDVSALKALITRTHDKARRAFGRTTCDVPRRFVLAGTTNERRFLQDPTGNRRFWPVDVTRIDLDGLAAARDQLLAEALARYRGGDRQLWLQGEAAAQAKRIQGERVVVDESYFELLEFIRASGEINGERFVTNARVYRRLGLDAGRRAGNVAHRVRAVMAALGWKAAPNAITVDGIKQRIYIWCGEGEPPEIEADPPF